MWKKGLVIWGQYRVVIRIRRKKIRKAKAELELNLATVVKGNKKLFNKYINCKRRAKENLHPLLDAAGNVTTESKEKNDILNAFLASIFRSQSN